MKTITRDELKAKLEKRETIVLLEALPAQYYMQGHLPGAKLFPHDQVSALASTVAPNKNAEIVVYCASATCKNSHMAADSLARLGYSNVRVYLEGKKDWQAAGLPLEVEMSSAAGAQQ